MFTNISFYASSRGYAPRGWKITILPYTNRLYYIYSGSAWFIDGSTEYRLKPQHLYFFPHSLEFRVRQDDSDPVDHLYFDFTATPPFTGKALVELKVEQDTPLALTVAALSSLFQKLRPDDPDLLKLTTSYFESLMILLSRERALPRLSDDRLLAAADRIHLYYHEAISLGELASIANMEENYFIRTFKQAMGITPYQYLREYRLNRASSLLEQGISVSEAAREVGYENTSSFSNAMKKSRGLYPTELIRKKR